MSKVPEKFTPPSKEELEKFRESTKLKTVGGQIEEFNKKVTFRGSSTRSGSRSSSIPESIKKRQVRGVVMSDGSELPKRINVQTPVSVKERGKLIAGGNTETAKVVEMANVQSGKYAAELGKFYGEIEAGKYKFVPNKEGGEVTISVSESGNVVVEGGTVAETNKKDFSSRVQDIEQKGKETQATVEKAQEFIKRKNNLQVQKKVEPEYKELQREQTLSQTPEGRLQIYGERLKETAEKIPKTAYEGLRKGIAKSEPTIKLFAPKGVKSDFKEQTSVTVPPDYKINVNTTPLKIGSEEINAEFVGDVVAGAAFIPVGLASLGAQTIVDPLGTPERVVEVGTSLATKATTEPVEFGATVLVGSYLWGGIQKQLNKPKTQPVTTKTTADINKYQLGVRLESDLSGTPGVTKGDFGYIPKDVKSFDYGKIQLYGSKTSTSSEVPFGTQTQAGVSIDVSGLKYTSGSNFNLKNFKINPLKTEAGFNKNVFTPKTTTTPPESFFRFDFVETPTGEVSGLATLQLTNIEVQPIPVFTPTKLDKLKADSNAAKENFNKFLKDERGSLGTTQQVLTNIESFSSTVKTDLVGVTENPVIPIVPTFPGIVESSSGTTTETDFVSPPKIIIPEFSVTGRTTKVNEETQLITPEKIVLPEPIETTKRRFKTKEKQDEINVPKFPSITGEKPEFRDDRDEERINVPIFKSYFDTVQGQEFKFDTPRIPTFESIKGFEEITDPDPKPDNSFPVFGGQRMKLPKQKSKKVPGFDVFVKTKGKFFKVTEKPLPKEKALFKGGKIVAESPSRTFKIVETGFFVKKGKDDKKLFNNFKKQFRPFKVKKGQKLFKENLFIEKSKFAIDTKKELEGITFKGIKANKMRRFKI